MAGAEGCADVPAGADGLQHLQGLVQEAARQLEGVEADAEGGSRAVRMKMCAGRWLLVTGFEDGSPHPASTTKMHLYIYINVRTPGSPSPARPAPRSAPPPRPAPGAPPHAGACCVWVVGTVSQAHDSRDWRSASNEHMYAPRLEAVKGAALGADRILVGGRRRGDDLLRVLLDHDGRQELAGLRDLCYACVHVRIISSQTAPRPAYSHIHPSLPAAAAPRPRRAGSAAAGGTWAGARPARPPRPRGPPRS